MKERKKKRKGTQPIWSVQTTQEKATLRWLKMGSHWLQSKQYFFLIQCNEMADLHPSVVHMDGAN